MPKVKLTERQAEHDRWAKNLLLAIGRDSYGKVAKVIGKTDKTFAARVRNPGTLTLDELSDICRHYKINRQKFLDEALGDLLK